MNLSFASVARRSFLAFVLAPALAYAQADYARAALGGRGDASLVVGDPVYLELKSGHPFLAIYAPHAAKRVEA